MLDTPMNPLVERITALLPPSEATLPAPVTCGRVLSLLDEAMGEDLRRYPDGRMLIWDIARHDGYTIPAYPMAGCGDVREFLHDEGVRNVPEWYEQHLGMNRSTYDAMYAYELVMVRNRALWRKVFVVPSTTMAQRSASNGPLLEAMREWMAFGLGETTGHEDPTLFRR